MQPLYEYVCHMKGHRNSNGELAEWVIKSHETGEILSSHKSEKKAKEHLQHMHIFGESVEGEAACSHCGWSADGVEEYNGRLLCPYCLKEFQRLDACRDANGYVKYDNITPRSDGFNPEGYKLIGESTYGNDMNKRIKIFMEGVSQLGLSPKQVEAIDNITKVCLESEMFGNPEDDDNVNPENDYNPENGEYDNPENDAYNPENDTPANDYNPENDETSSDEDNPEYAHELTMDEMYDKLIEQGVSKQTINIVTDIIGWNPDSMLKILYAATGYKSFDQLPEF